MEDPADSRPSEGGRSHEHESRGDAAHRRALQVRLHRCSPFRLGSRRIPRRCRDFKSRSGRLVAAYLGPGSRASAAAVTLSRSPASSWSRPRPATTPVGALPVAGGAITLGAESVGLQDGGFGPGRLGRGSAGMSARSIAVSCHRCKSGGVRNVKGNSLEADRSYGCPVRSRSPRARSFRLGTNQDRPHLLRLARVRHRQQLKPERRVDSAQEPGNRAAQITGWRPRQRQYVYRFRQFTLRAGWTGSRSHRQRVEYCEAPLLAQ